MRIFDLMSLWRANQRELLTGNELEIAADKYT